VLSITPHLVRNIQRPPAAASEFSAGTEMSFRRRPDPAPRLQAQLPGAPTQPGQVAQARPVGPSGPVPMNNPAPQTLPVPAAIPTPVVPPPAPAPAPAQPAANQPNRMMPATSVTFGGPPGSPVEVTPIPAPTTSPAPAPNGQ
jgi:general secretion pathway protein D